VATLADFPRPDQAPVRGKELICGGRDDRLLEAHRQEDDESLSAHTGDRHLGHQPLQRRSLLDSRLTVDEIGRRPTDLGGHLRALGRCGDCSRSKTHPG
jgi:hypothetical protein